MKHFFLDTNITLDLLANRKPFSENAVRIFEKSEGGKLKLYISSLSFATIYYILKKEIGHKKTIFVLKELSDLVEMLDVSSDHIKNALHSEFGDFEDAIQYYAARSVKKIDAIVTRNPKDFKKSDLLVMSPEEVLNL